MTERPCITQSEGAAGYTHAVHFTERPLIANRLRFVSWSLFAAALILLALVQPAFAFNENPSAETTSVYNEANCGGCHNPWNGSAGLFNPSAVHSGYVTVSNKCKQCHAVHNADQFGQKLLPGPTVSDSCNTCHDGTGGNGVYGVFAARGLTPSAEHTTEVTNVVPGGNPLTGGDATLPLSAWSTGNLSCIDCHSPHGASVVASYTSDRRRGSLGVPSYYSSKLLKQRPGNAATATPYYGSDWCLGCHRGRASANPLHNHPVETSATFGPGYYWFGSVGVVATDTPTTTVVVGEMGLNNRGYLMPFPRRGAQTGHLPICQQCHKDARNPAVGGVGSLSADGNTADVATWTSTMTDGRAPNDNPRFTNFPHEGMNPNFLVETYDDLCLNCHPPAGLP